jgi:hypothetical protein
MEKFNDRPKLEVIKGGGEGESRLERARRRVREAYQGSTYGDHLQAVPAPEPEQIEPVETPMAAEGEIVTDHQRMAQDARQKIARIHAVESPPSDMYQPPSA